MWPSNVNVTFSVLCQPPLGIQAWCYVCVQIGTATLDVTDSSECTGVFGVMIPNVSF